MIRELIRWGRRKLAKAIAGEHAPPSQVDEEEVSSNVPTPHIGEDARSLMVNRNEEAERVISRSPAPLKGSLEERLLKARPHDRR